MLYSVGVAQIGVACRCGSCFLQANPNAIVGTRESKRRIRMRLGERANPKGESECDSRNARIQKANPNAMPETQNEKVSFSATIELSRKLCHTRLAEFISATQQNLAAAQGKSTLAGQNLRDELLASHVKTKSLLH